MATQTASLPSLVARPGPVSTIAFAGSVLGFLGAVAVFSWSLLNWDDSAREVITGPGQVAGCALAAAGAALLIIVLPQLLRGIAPWAVVASTLGVAFVLVDAWYNGTVAVAVANEIDDATFDAVYQAGWAFLFSLPKMLFCLVGFVGVAVSGWRTGLIARPVCILLAVAGVASLVPPFMPGILVASLAFALIARAARQ